MLAFIILLLFGLAIAFFASQNTLPVTIALANYQLPPAPLYVIIVGAMLIGFMVSWVVSLIDSASTLFALRRKESAIHASHKQVEQLQARIHTLEIENARLKGEHKEPVIVERKTASFSQPSFFERLRHNLHVS